jgi:GNAT superfamily N-acetyltransferase
MIAIAAATAADAEALAALRWEFRAGRKERPVETEQAFVARCSAWMRRELEAGAPWRAWIATDEGRPVGQVWLQLFSKLPNPVGEGACHAYVSNLYVQPASRGGVGSRLLTAALDHARAAGADRVILWPSDRSVTLYERHGFMRAGEVMILKR